jgi:exosome complex component RRP45
MGFRIGNRTSRQPLIEVSISQVHPSSERDPIPLAVHHHPICSTFAFFNCKTTTAAAATAVGGGDSEDAAAAAAATTATTTKRVVVVDPSWQEELVMDGKIVFGVNPYREICTLHLAGNMLIDKDVVIR